MRSTKNGFTRKKALTIVFLVAAVLIAAILLRGCKDTEDVSTRDGRIRFLAQFGWEVDPETEDVRSVQLPETLEGTLAQYNEMQRRQGYDLSLHLGEQCQQVSYLLTNYPDGSQTVLVTMYIQGSRVIAADIHSTSLNGFMHGLRMD